MEELNLKDLRREYISYDMSPQIAGILFGPLAQELKSVPEMEKKVADIETFAFCSEVLWGTK